MRMRIMRRLSQENVKNLIRILECDLKTLIGARDFRCEPFGISFDIPCFPEEDTMVMHYLTSFFEGTGIELEVPEISFRFTIG